MKRNKVLFVIAGVLLSISSQAALIDVNFDSNTPGVYSNLGVYAASTFGARTGTAVTVVSVTTNGYLANGADQALKIGGAGTPAWSITYGPAATGATQGVFSMDFAASTAFGCYLGGNGSSGQIQMGMDSLNKIWFKEVATGSTLIYFDQKWAKNAEQTLEVTYNATTKLFTGKINGTNLTIGARTTFGFAKDNLTSIGDVNLTYSTAGTTFWVDNLNLEMIPEPTTLSLFAVFSAGIFLLRRIQHN